MYTGTLIEELIATVERAAQEMRVAQVPDLANQLPVPDPLVNEAWLPTVEEAPVYDSKLLGVA